MIQEDIEIQHIQPETIKKEKLNTDIIGGMAFSTNGQIRAHNIPQNNINPTGIILASPTHNLFSMNLEHNDFIPMIKEKIICKNMPRSAEYPKINPIMNSTCVPSRDCPHGIIK